MKFLCLLAIIFIAAVSIGYFFKQKLIMESTVRSTPAPQIRYVAIGDSYTIGQGVAVADRWPNLLVDHLRKDAVQITLVSNLGISGYTSQDVVLKELPQLKEIKPDFVTVLIGANDVYQKVASETFKKNLTQLLDEIQLIITDHQNIVLITIPNYSKSPAGLLYGTGDSEERKIKELNEIIKAEADRRVIEVVDIFPMTDKLTDPSFFVADRLHPSLTGYKEWEKVIYPVVKKKLSIK